MITAPGRPTAHDAALGPRAVIMPGRNSAYPSKDDAVPPGRLPDSIPTQALDCAPGGHLVDPTAWIERPKGQRGAALELRPDSCASGT